ncbi:hypothetical protein HPP92_006970 [Vanilla planifolia]|uniref:Uncharacterized protein n=1 Tax=Vanilla planifolia TaxID=51239 RepID=A0A835V5N7_VANPL|nr:hypothetical protein HPP92_007205 [Vanilla planifolia]KAG0490107.1 hypothetical protein HPP92_006970 [Vanilla planifolia]
MVHGQSYSSPSVIAANVVYILRLSNAKSNTENWGPTRNFALAHVTRIRIERDSRSVIQKGISFSNSNPISNQVASTSCVPEFCVNLTPGSVAALASFMPNPYQSCLAYNSIDSGKLDPSLAFSGIM